MTEEELELSVISSLVEHARNEIRRAGIRNKDDQEYCDTLNNILVKIMTYENRKEFQNEHKRRDFLPNVVSSRCS